MLKEATSDGTAALFRRILVAVDASKQSEWAVQLAGALADATGAKVALVHAYRVDAGYSPELAPPIEDVLEELKEAGGKILRQRRGLLPAAVETEAQEFLSEGEAARQIVRAAEAWHADLIVMGTHGRGRLSQFLVGSTAEAVIRMSRCPVLSVAHEPRKHVDAAEAPVAVAVAAGAGA
jgi:nucleotide-binding universal stress UspA family protein